MVVVGLVIRVVDVVRHEILFDAFAEQELGEENTEGRGRGAC